MIMSIGIILGTVLLYQNKSFSKDEVSLIESNIDYDKASLIVVDFVTNIRNHYKHQNEIYDWYTRILVLNRTDKKSFIMRAATSDLEGLCKLQVKFNEIKKKLKKTNLPFKKITNIVNLFIDYYEKEIYSINVRFENNFKHFLDFFSNPSNRINKLKLKGEIDCALESLQNIISKFFVNSFLSISDECVTLILHRLNSNFKDEIAKYRNQAKNVSSYSKILMINHEWPAIQIINILSKRTIFESVKKEQRETREWVKKELERQDKEEEQRRLEKKKNSWTQKPKKWMKSVKSIFTRSKDKNK